VFGYSVERPDGLRRPDSMRNFLSRLALTNPPSHKRVRTWITIAIQKIRFWSLARISSVSGAGYPLVGAMPQIPRLVLD
jgi:hypothetical protein